MLHWPMIKPMPNDMIVEIEISSNLVKKNRPHHQPNPLHLESMIAPPPQTPQTPRFISPPLQTPQTPRFISPPPQTPRFIQHCNLTKLIITFLGFFLLTPIFSQSKLTNFVTPADTFNAKRLGLILGSETTLYTSATIALYQYWYKDYPLNHFHLFNDNGEWLQYDKMGHFYTAYFETNLTTEFYQWTGMSDNAAYWSAAATGSILQLTIEVFDGFSEKWGFSVGDFAANTFGATLCTAQNMLWDEQRIKVKFSSHFTDYSGYDQPVQDRAAQLFGTTGPEKVLKDYNGQTTWLSVNPSMFMSPETRFPKWLMISGGYSVDGLLGGYENKWCDDPEMKPEDCPPDQLTDYSQIPRERQFYLSLDVDLTQIPTNSPYLKMVFNVLNIVKFPAPALQLQNGNLSFKPIYF